MSFGQNDELTEPPVKQLMSEKNGSPTHEYKDQAIAAWPAGVRESLRASRQVAWIIAACAGAVAVLEGFALAQLQPLKSVVNYTITVDRKTGFVETAQRPAIRSQRAPRPMPRALLAQYVIDRETVNAADPFQIYHRVMLRSAPDVGAQYDRLMRKTTPASPLTGSPATLVNVTVKTVLPLSPTTAVVRFDRTRHDIGSSGAPQSYIATLSFRYAAAPTSLGDRFINPSGFQVTRYRRDVLTLAPAAILHTAPLAGSPATLLAQPSTTSKTR